MVLKTFSTAALALTVALSAAAAFAADVPPLTDAKRTEITDAMVAKGYVVRSVKTEDGLYEVYAMKDGKKMEIYLDESLKVVTK